MPHIDNSHILNDDYTVFNYIPGMLYRCNYLPSRDENIYNYDLVLDFVSSGSYELLGIHQKEMLEGGANTLEKLMHPDDAKRTHMHCYDQVSEKKPYEIKYRLQLPDGTTKWVWDMGGAVWNNEGDILYFEGLIMDISEQKFQELELEEENKQLKFSLQSIHGLGNIIGKSKKMLEVYELIMKAAENDMNIILYGETGCGKDIVARTIHEYSGCKGDYVPVNCSAIPEQLLESEFFGHMKGAFSGAYSNNKGYIAAADNGTLFLDEIGELPLSLQAKLLRVLENKTYTPLGSNTPKESNFRLISATNRDLVEMVKEKNMRSDFFYRLNVLTMHLPSLRERMDDIPLLMSSYLERKNYSTAVPLKVRIGMQQYDWPGNIRELHNFLDRLIVLGEAALATLDIPIENDFGFSLSLGLTHKDASMAFERQFIKNALLECHGHRGNCAKMLDLNLRTLQRKMKLLNIQDK